MKIAILGCGYLGSAVALLWKRKGHQITATTCHPERLKELSKIAQKSSLLKGTDEKELALLIADHELILVTVAADSTEHYESTYLSTAQTFHHLALEMGVSRQLIYTSSTAVYGDHQGLWVDEIGDLLGAGELAKVLIETERTYLSLKDVGWHVCVLRLSEIYGPERELSKRVKQLKGEALPGSGNFYTNMIHKVDATHAIDYALHHHLEGIYNVVDDEHPTRKELYDKISLRYGLPKVKWDPSLTSLHTANKRISNHKIKSAGFIFLHPHRILD